MTTFYGVHAERAASALVHLLRLDQPLPSAEFVPTAVNARHTIIGSIRDRLSTHFGARVDADDPAAAASVRLESLRREPMRELAYVAARLPRLRVSDRLAPSHFLADSQDPTAQLWIVAARDLILANHALDAATPQPWRTDPLPHAALAADTAHLVEAITLLDDRLVAGGALSEHVVPPESPSSNIAVARWLASSIGRLADWTAEHSRLDAAEPAWPYPVEHLQRIRMVNGPQNVVDAQRQLQSYLEPYVEEDWPAPHRLSANSINLIARNQKVLLEQVEAARPDSTWALRDLLGDAMYALRGLHDATGPRQHPVLVAQQREISMGVRAGHIRPMNADQVGELVAATEAVLGTWAAGVRREVLRHDTAVRIARRGQTIEHVYGRISPTGQAQRALNALADLQPPVRPLDEPFGVRLTERTRLADALTRVNLLSTPAWVGPTPIPSTPSSTSPRR